MSSITVGFNKQLAVTNSARPEFTDGMSLQDKVIAVIRTIHDPELPVNIYDLGLIYDIAIDQREVTVKMTLTSPNCPVAGSLPAQVECAIRDLDEVDSACVQLTWDPPWNADRLSDEVKLTLGLL